MKVMIIGADGQLGTDLSSEMKEKADVIPLTFSDGDISDRAVTERLFETHAPDVVINTAAFHNVPECENQPVRAFEVNALGARNLAVVSQERGVRMVQVSTDYVFDGAQKRPYTENDLPNPLSVYANTKLSGEYFTAAHCENHIIARVSGIYGKARCIGKGSNFVTTMLKLYREGKPIRVVTDEILTPTSTIEISRQISKMIEADVRGLFHVTAEGACSWHEFAQTIFDVLQYPVQVAEAKVADFPPPVRRPHYSVLENRRLNEAKINIMADWKTALTEFLTNTDVETL